MEIDTAPATAWPRGHPVRPEHTDAIYGASGCGGDANTALRLVAGELEKDLDVVEFTECVRVNTLRKMLDERFGADAWPAMNKLWRSAPPSPGAPRPSEDQSREPAGSLPAGCNQPRWIGELNEPGGAERAWMIENGLWCG